MPQLTHLHGGMGNDFAIVADLDRCLTWNIEGYAIVGRFLLAVNCHWLHAVVFDDVDADVIWLANQVVLIDKSLIA